MRQNQWCWKMYLCLLEEEPLVEDDIERLPYQLTRFYQNELARFDEAYLRWVNERYEQERGLFEQEQERLYNAAVVLGVQVGEQQEQHIEVECKVPGNVINNVDVNDDDEENNMIAPQQEEEDEHIIINEADDDGGDNIIIINEVDELPNEVEDIIIMDDDGIAPVPMPVNCHVINDAEEEEEEEDNEAELVNEEEEQ